MTKSISPALLPAKSQTRNKRLRRCAVPKYWASYTHLREATHGEYPRFALFENVPGALSSAGGRDCAFSCKIADKKQAPAPLCCAEILGVVHAPSEINASASYHPESPGGGRWLRLTADHQQNQPLHPAARPAHPMRNGTAPCADDGDGAGQRGSAGGHRPHPQLQPRTAPFGASAGDPPP